jgi:hypothetical protein
MAATSSNSLQTRQEKVERDLAVHEAVCAERYGSIISRLGRIEVIIWGGGGTLISALLTIIYILLQHVKF